MAETKKTELLVIGGGPGGYPAAFKAADLGMKVTLVDPEANPGGVCLYRGCVPSKALLHVVKFLHEVEQASQWGVNLKEPEIDIDTLRGWKESVIERLTGGLGQLVKRRDIDYIRGTAELQDAHTANIATTSGGQEEIGFDQAVIATGSKPAMIPGLPDTPRIMNSRQALDVEEAPERLLVVGGGYIGLELGQVYAALGSKVTMVEMLPEILPGTDRDLVKLIEKRVEGQFEDILTDTKVGRIEESDKGLKVALEGESNQERQFDKAMIAIGRKPLTEGVGLENTNIVINEQGFIEVDEQRRTGESNIFAVGDVAGEPMLAHKATSEGRIAAEVAAGEDVAYDPRAIPFVVFSDPEIAWCGLSERQAKEQGIDYEKRAFPWAASGRAMTISRTDGLTKVLAEPDSNRILGVGIAGHGAGEMLAEAVLAMEMGAVTDDIALAIHTHPTLSETIMEACEAFSGFSTHYPGKSN